MDNIFDDFTAAELREIFREPTENWPDDFCNYVHGIMANNLLDMWLGDHSDEEYREEVRQVIEDLTYGYRDGNGGTFGELDEDIEEDGQRRLFP